MKHKGIVLRAFMPEHHKISILDQELGALEVFVGHQKKTLAYFQHGALIHYNLNTQSTRLALHDADLIALPFQLAFEDIVFFHHMLELYYYFTPPGSNSSMIFDLLYTILFQGYTATTKEKLVYISLFFMYSGFYAEQVPFNMEIIRTASFDLIQKQFDTVDSCTLKSWLMQCFNLHPHKQYFKTLFYYYLPQEAVL